MMFVRVLLASAFACSLALGEGDTNQRRPNSQLVAEHRGLAPRLYAPPGYRQLSSPYTYDDPEGALQEGWGLPGGLPAEALLDILPFPKHLVLVAVGAVKWVVAHASLLVLGAVLMVGLCTFTPFCHISVETFEQLESLPAEYYRRLDSAARALGAAIDTYGKREQTSKLKTLKKEGQDTGIGKVVEKELKDVEMSESMKEGQEGVQEKENEIEENVNEKMAVVKADLESGKHRRSRAVWWP